MERILVYPADEWACGHYRMIWPALNVREQLADRYQIQVVQQGTRDFSARISPDGKRVTHVDLPHDDVAAIVIQRPTHHWLAQAVPILREQGIAVIVDMDDDLTTIHPRNIAHHIMHPKQGDPAHSWVNAQQACLDATLVTTSTPALMLRYAPRGNGMVLPNYVPASYLDIPHDDGTDVTWCGTLNSHPNDLPILGGAIQRLVQDGVTFRTVGDGTGVQKALGLAEPCKSTGPVALHEWPAEMGKSGITLAPLADTSFNAAKSWLKPLEAMALGVPVVMSPRVEYLRLRRETGNLGFLAEKSKHWEQQVRRLILSEEARAEQSTAGRTYVRENLTIEQQAWRWAEAWAEAIDRQRGRVEVSA